MIVSCNMIFTVRLWILVFLVSIETSILEKGQGTTLQIVYWGVCHSMAPPVQWMRKQPQVSMRLICSAFLIHEVLCSLAYYAVNIWVACVHTWTNLVTWWQYQNKQRAFQSDCILMVLLLCLLLRIAWFAVTILNRLPKLHYKYMTGFARRTISHILSKLS